MTAKVTKLVVVLAIGLSYFAAMETASVGSTETTEPVTGGNTTEVVCNSLDIECGPPPAPGMGCVVLKDPTGCTPPRCVCGYDTPGPMCYGRKYCPPGATYYLPREYFACWECACLPEPCATCDPNKTTMRNYPTCSCSDCECIDGKCIDHSL